VNTPRTTAFFLFLGLAVLPVSLKVAGFRVGFSPNLSAAGDAWQQIADVFGAGFQTAQTLAVSSQNDSTAERLIAADLSTPSPVEPACRLKSVRVIRSFQAVSTPHSSKSIIVCPKASSREVASERVTVPAAAAAAIRVSFEAQMRVLEELGAIKLETATRQELLKRVERSVSNLSLGTVRNFSIPQSLRMVVRMKPSAIPSAIKAAECKVRAAMELEQRLERERAMLSASPATGPDYCEF
jgi:hypothetical protein